MPSVGKWIAGGVAGLVVIGGVVYLVLRKPKAAAVPLRSVDPLTEIYPLVSKTTLGGPLAGGAGLSLQAEAGTATFESGIATTGSTTAGFVEGLAGLDLGLSSYLEGTKVTSQGAVFPPSYPSRTGATLDLQKMGEAATWSTGARSEVLKQHDNAMAPIYAKWKGLRLAREWLGAAGVPLLFSNIKSANPWLTEAAMLARMLEHGTAIRLAPAIVTFDPKEARNGGAIWLPPEEPPTFGPKAIKGVDLEYARKTLRSAVWDKTAGRWRTIPWHNFGLEHRLPNTGIYPDKGHGRTGVSLELEPGTPSGSMGYRILQIAQLGSTGGKVKDLDLSPFTLPNADRDMVFAILADTFS